MIISKKKYNKLCDQIKELTELNEKLSSRTNEDKIMYSRISMLELVKSSEKYCISKEDKRKLDILRNLIEFDMCVSNYVTHTKSGELLIDVQQIPRTANEMLSLFDFIKGVIK